MIVAKALNVPWIVWTSYVFVKGFGRFHEPHVHTYVYLFFAGVGLILCGSIWLKILDIRRRPTALARVGFGLWLARFLALVACIFAGARLTSSQFVRAHVIFNHVHYLIFFLGLIPSMSIQSSSAGWIRTLNQSDSSSRKRDSWNESGWAS